MNNTESHKEEKLVNLKDLKWIYKSLIKGWYLLLLLPVVTGSIGAFMSYKKVSQYTSQMQLLLESNEVYDYQASINRSVGMQYTDISNQIRVLKSYDLIEQAVDKLDLNVTYYIAGRINTIEVFWGVPFRVDLKSFDNRLANKRLIFKVIDDESYQIVFEYEGKDVVNTHKFNTEVISKWYVLNVKSFIDISSITAD